MEEKYMCLVAGKGAPTKWHANEDEAITESHRLARKESRQCFILKAIAVTVPHTKTNYIEDGKMTMKRCNCAECGDFAENKPHIKPNKERYEAMLRAQGFGVKSGDDGVSEVEKDSAKKSRHGWINYQEGMPKPQEDELVDLIFSEGTPIAMVRAGDYNWSREQASKERTPYVAWYRPARLAELQAQKKAPVADKDGWISHTPGDPMPCDPDDYIELKFLSGREFSSIKAKFMMWSGGTKITAWRPARQEQDKEVKKDAPLTKFYVDSALIEEIDRIKAELEAVTQDRDKLKERMGRLEVTAKQYEEIYNNLSNEAADLVEALAFHLPTYYTTRREQVKAFIDKCRGVNNG